MARLFVCLTNRKQGIALRIRTLNPVEERVEEIIIPSLEHNGYELVRAKLMESGRKTLQIMIDRQDGKGVTVEDCATVSHIISPLLDVEDPIDGKYELEVSSAGIDRPLTRKKDFEYFLGYEIKVTLHNPIEGRKRFKGILSDFKEGNIVALELENEELTAEIAFDNIVSAKLVLNDALITSAETN